jgi:hypothetical protein
MYFSMAAKALSPTTRQGGPFQVTEALGIVPADIELGPLEAEFLASIALRFLYKAPLKDCYWLNAIRQEEATFGKWIVLRTLFTSKSLYKQHLSNIEDVEGNILKKSEIDTIMNKDVPEHFWITEITLTDLYTANKHKLGEILFKLSDPKIVQGDSPFTFTRKLFETCIAVRLPGNILIPKVGKKQISLIARETDLIGHVQLLRTRCPKPPFEW